MKNELNIKIDDYTNFYLKIERKYSDRQDEYDKWCNVTISISNNYINYNKVLLKKRKYHLLSQI